MKSGFSGLLSQKVRLVNKTLEQVLSRNDFIDKQLQKPVRYALEGPGKRIRSCLVLWCCELIKGKVNRNALIASAAIEMVHTYSLIHDDLPAMDNDDYRRGRLTSHKKFDEATAILTGDALLTLAFELLAKEINKPETAIRLVTELAEAAGPAGMVAGQMADMKATDKSEIRNPKSETNSNDQKKKIQNNKEGGVNPALLKRIHTNKTAKMFRCAAAMGAICGGATQSQLSRFKEYGLKIGLGFQIADDILDVNQSSSHLGKTSGKDSKQGKATYPAVVGLEKSRKLSRKLADEAIAALKPFGPKADTLRRLTEALLSRTK
jgi:geranylgeranyl diphosphate synthase type II